MTSCAFAGRVFVGCVVFNWKNPPVHICVSEYVGSNWNILWSAWQLAG